MKQLSPDQTCAYRVAHFKQRPKARAMPPPPVAWTLRPGIPRGNVPRLKTVSARTTYQGVAAEAEVIAAPLCAGSPHCLPTSGGLPTGGIVYLQP
jgi:hypothetical protein